MRTIGWRDERRLSLAPDCRPKSSIIITFDDPDDACNALDQSNGYKAQSRSLEVRERDQQPMSCRYRKRWNEQSEPLYLVNPEARSHGQPIDMYCIHTGAAGYKLG
jgi:hypothetical protein